MEGDAPLHLFDLRVATIAADERCHRVNRALRFVELPRLVHHNGTQCVIDVQHHRIWGVVLQVRCTVCTQATQQERSLVNRSLLAMSGGEH